MLKSPRMTSSRSTTIGVYARARAQATLTRASVLNGAAHRRTIEGILESGLSTPLSSVTGMQQLANVEGGRKGVWKTTRGIG